MFSVTNKSGPFVAPQVNNNPAFAEAEKLRNTGNESINFDKIVGESNSQAAEQFEKDKQSVGEAGELRIGESKNDKEFREMLERVSGKKQETLKNKLEKDDYLNLMVTQLKYQDPTKPLENHEMATQLAQFNTVEQLIGVNKTLQSMQNQNAQANIDRLTPYLGKIVDVSGAKLRLGPDLKPSHGAVEIATQAGSVGIQIKDSAGEVVRNIALGEKDAGRHTFEWDGKTDAGAPAKAGDYTFEVMASSRDGKTMQATTSFSAKVEAITDLANGGKLDTASGKVESKDIIAIRPDIPMTTQATGPAPATPTTKPTAPTSQTVLPPRAPTGSAPGDSATRSVGATPAPAKREAVKTEAREQSPKPEQKHQSVSKESLKVS